MGGLSEKVACVEDSRVVTVDSDSLDMETPRLPTILLMLRHWQPSDLTLPTSLNILYNTLQTISTACSIHWIASPSSLCTPSKPGTPHHQHNIQLYITQQAVKEDRWGEERRGDFSRWDHCRLDRVTTIAIVFCYLVIDINTSCGVWAVRRWPWLWCHQFVLFTGQRRGEEITGKQQLYINKKNHLEGQARGAI